VLNTYPKSRVPASRFLCSKHSGFSLLELMIGVAVLAILASIAMPSFQTMIESTKIRTAAESIQNGLQKARAEAIARNTNVAFTLGADSGWSICVNSCTTTPGITIESRPASEGSKNVSRTSYAADLSAALSVTFNNLGRVNNLGSALPNNLDGSKQLAKIDLTTPGSTHNLIVTIGKFDIPSQTYVGSSPRVCDPHATTGSTSAC